MTALEQVLVEVERRDRFAGFCVHPLFNAAYERVSAEPNLDRMVSHLVPYTAPEPEGDSRRKTLALCRGVQDRWLMFDGSEDEVRDDVCSRCEERAASLRRRFFESIARAAARVAKANVEQVSFGRRENIGKVASGRPGIIEEITVEIDGDHAERLLAWIIASGAKAAERAGITVGDPEYDDNNGSTLVALRFNCRRAEG